MVINRSLGYDRWPWSFLWQLCSARGYILVKLKVDSESWFNLDDLASNGTRQSGTRNFTCFRSVLSVVRYSSILGTFSCDGTDVAFLSNLHNFVTVCGTEFCTRKNFWWRLFSGEIACIIKQGPAGLRICISRIFTKCLYMACLNWLPVCLFFWFAPKLSNFLSPHSNLHWNKGAAFALARIKVCMLCKLFDAEPLNRISTCRSLWDFCLFHGDVAL